MPVTFDNPSGFTSHYEANTDGTWTIILSNPGNGTPTDGAKSYVEVSNKYSSVQDAIDKRPCYGASCPKGVATPWYQDGNRTITSIDFGNDLMYFVQLADGGHFYAEARYGLTAYDATDKATAEAIAKSIVSVR